MHSRSCAEVVAGSATAHGAQLGPHSRPPVAGDLIDGVGALGGEGVGDSVLAVEAELAVGGTPGQGVDARQLVAQDLPQARRQLELETRAMLEDGFPPAAPGILRSAVLQLRGGAR